MPDKHRNLELCENCGKHTFRTRFDSARPDVTRCERCRGWSVGLAPNLEASSLYGAEYFNGAEYFSYALSEPSQRLNFRRKLRLLSRYIPVPLRELSVLELGSATGEFLDVLRENGVTRTLGVEVSDYARGEALERGLPVLSPDAPELASAVAELRPHLICAWDVWEHLPHPVETLRSYLASSAPSCVFAVTTVDASSAVARARKTRWRQFHPPTHLHYPTRASFRLLAEELGFRVRVQRSFGMYRPLVEYANAALGSRAGGLFARASHIASLPLYLNLHDIQLVIATRP